MVRLSPLTACPPRPGWRRPSGDAVLAGDVGSAERAKVICRGRNLATQLTPVDMTARHVESSGRSRRAPCPYRRCALFALSVSVIPPARQWHRWRRPCGVSAQHRLFLDVDVVRRLRVADQLRRIAQLALQRHIGHQAINAVSARRCGACCRRRGRRWGCRPSSKQQHEIEAAVGGSWWHLPGVGRLRVDSGAGEERLSLVSGSRCEASLFGRREVAPAVHRRRAGARISSSGLWCRRGALRWAFFRRDRW